ncbi:hypothetical protein B0J11DRAFT_342902 [Dendryphion nanum]|uniref:Uncharacterized protein n=1 Tax=Dendryphion nanum TaxID=256645 RepID=A0A9P9DNV2_9PLEO|nr:hypothetical protein B0J11DRAFT_342902 [Dendryphion nanum]
MCAFSTTQPRELSTLLTHTLSGLGILLSIHTGSAPPASRPAPSDARIVNMFIVAGRAVININIPASARMGRRLMYHLYPVLVSSSSPRLKHTSSRASSISTMGLHLTCCVYAAVLALESPRCPSFLPSCPQLMAPSHLFPPRPTSSYRSYLTLGHCRDMVLPAIPPFSSFFPPHPTRHPSIS